MSSRTPRAFIALLAATLSLAAQADVQVLPAGSFAARDGRPGPGKAWSVDDATGRRLAEQLTAQGAKAAFVFDIDHQTLRAETNGAPAPAAGWATRFEWRPGLGLFATDVRWTEQAQGWIKSGAYRYVSPVITFDAGGRITGVLMAAITNYPALLGMEPLGRDLAAQLSAQYSSPDPTEHDVTILEALIAKLGLKSGTTEAEALQAVADLHARAGAKTTALSGELTSALGLAAGADEAAALSAITTLVTKARTGDTSQAAQIAALQGQVATLTAAASEQAVARVVEDAVTAGRAWPAQREALLSMGRRDLEALTALIKASPVIPGARSQTNGVPPANADDPVQSAEALAGKARAYQAEQMAAGVQITTAQAVAHVAKGHAPAATA